MKAARKNDVDVFEGNPSLAKAYSLIRGWRRANIASTHDQHDVKLFVVNRPAKQKSIKEQLRPLIERLCAKHPSISIDSEVLGGTPHIKGTRLSVRTILGKLHLYGNVQTVLDIYEPHLSEEQVKAAIAYAQDFLEMGCASNKP